MHRVNLLVVSLFLCLTAQAQEKGTYQGYPSLVWPKLYDITFVTVTDKLGEYNKPVFSTAAQSINGKVVSLPGYMVPFTNGTSGSTFILTSLPLNACFFCGVGGPETVIEVHLKAPVSYTAKLVEIKGTLRLNDRDPDKMIYQLENASFEGEIEVD